MAFFTIIFFLSFAGIAAIFGLKYWEMRTERVRASALREKFDIRALQAKELLAAARIDLAKLLPAAFRLGRLIVHEAALGFAVFARIAERQAHRLADLVSHKHRFEKRETRSEFLKKVAEHKSENAGLDTLNDNGHNTQTPL